MQAQQEQKKNQYLSNNPFDRYGWLSVLNMAAFVLFGFAFLIVDDEARWLCLTALFFSFILIFVFKIFNQQQCRISLQQIQINELLESQQNLQEQMSFRASSTVDKLPIGTNELDESQVAATLNQTEYIDTESLLNTKERAQAIHPSPPQERVFSQSELHSQLRNEIEHFPEQAESQNQNTSRTEQDSTLIKDLKGMTSLWSAFVDWFKGGNSIVRLGIIVLLIGVILLLRFASDYWQPTLSTKLAGVATAGIALTSLGYWLRNKRHGYAISIQGAGLGVLYLVLFSAFKLAVITSVTLSYGLLMLLLAITLLLALRQNALILAFIALGSGFIAPFILNTGNNNIPALFTYYLVLNTALAVIAFFKPWRIFNTISLLATFGVGGLSLWLKAQPEQFTHLTVLVWLHFVLYLFISVRYSLNISKFKIAFKNVPLIDTALIFATPFMAFTMYAGLVYQNPRLLSLASAILAFVYFSIGYFLHKKYQSLSLLIQSFYGLGLTFLALILPFAFNAQWTSTGWAVQAIALIWIGCRHHLRNSLLFGMILLGMSTLSWLKSFVIDGQVSLLAVLFLSISYLAVLYIFSTPQLNENTTDKDQFAESIQPSQDRLNTIIDAVHGFAKVACILILQVIVVIYSHQLYQDLILSKNAIFMLILTLISTALTLRTYQINKQITVAVQTFAGLALAYLAMIPLMLWQADVISIWWTIQALLMLVFATHLNVSSIRQAASILLLGSSLAFIVAILESDPWRSVAAVLLVIALAINSYWLWYKSGANKIKSDRFIAGCSLLLSFLFVPYLAHKFFDLMDWNILTFALPMMVWWVLLSLIYKFKRQSFDPAWMIVSVLLLGFATLEIATTIVLNVYELQLWNVPSRYKLSILMTIVLWSTAYLFCLKNFNEQLNKIIAKILMVVFVLLLAVFGGLISWDHLSFVPLLLLVPVAVLFSSLKISYLYFLKDNWIENKGIVLLGLLTTWLLSFLHDGLWGLFYLILFNPIDLLSLAIFILTVIAIKPIIKGLSRELKIASVAVLIITGLILVSSIMLRSLHHYLHLPYWSIEAWHNGLVQASLTILWVILSLVLTTFASKKSLRYVWMLGIAVLALVIAKLIFLDLSHTHTITRIVSFIGSGLVMLVIGYFSPLPPAENSEKAKELSE